MIKSLISIEAKGLLACLGRSTLSCKRPSARHFSGLPRKQPREEQLVQKIAGSDRPAREWEKRDASIKKRFGSWNPTRKISRQKMQEMRDLTVSMPHLRTIDLANMYTISPEAVRRILESKWVPKSSEEDAVLQRFSKYKEKRKAFHEAATTQVIRANERILHVEAIDINHLIDPRLGGGNKSLHKPAKMHQKQAGDGEIRKYRPQARRNSEKHADYHRESQRRAVSTGDLID